MKTPKSVGYPGTKSAFQVSPSTRQMRHHRISQKFNGDFSSDSNQSHAPEAVLEPDLTQLTQLHGEFSGCTGLGEICYNGKITGSAIGRIEFNFTR